MKVLTFCWNSNGINLCETMNEFKKDKTREGVTGFFKQKCEFADFLPKMKGILVDNDPDVVCVGFEKDPNTGTYFHSTLLPARMTKFGYKSIYKETKKGVLGALRLSVYAKKELSIQIKQNKTYNCSYSVDGAGAMSASFLLNGELTLTIINAYISFDQESVKLARKSFGGDTKTDSSTGELTQSFGDSMIRQDALNYANMCYNGIIREMVLKEKKIPDYVVMMGDLNYRINQMSLTAEIISDMLSKTDETSVSSLVQEYYKQDELHNQIVKENIYKYNEGVGNIGPTFAPTCVMRKNRDCESNYLNCWETNPDYILPSWCNRILYRSYNINKMCCTKYDRFDHGKTIKKSNNTGVYAIFQIGNCTSTDQE